MFFNLSKIATFLIDPIFVVLIFCFLGLIKIKNHKLIALFVFVIIYLISTPFISNKALHFLEHLEKPSKLANHYNAVVVLSGMLNLNVDTSKDIEFGGSVDRILAGIDLVRNGKADYLIISGGDGSLISRGLSEARLLKKFAIKWGINSQKIIIDADSRNTYENALESAKLVKKHDFDKLLLITSAFHMYRAHGCFRRAGLDVDVLPVDYEAITNAPDFRYFLPSSGALSGTNQTIHELIGILVYGMSGKADYAK